MTPARELFARGLIVPPTHDPADIRQPPIHEAFALAAELSRGSQIALTGGIGSGKTTEILLTQEQLGRHSDAVNILVDMAEYTDLNEINPGAILATLGIELYRRLKRKGEVKSDATVAYGDLRKLALPRTEWVHPDSLYEEDYDGHVSVRVDVPGLMRPRFPVLRKEVKEVKELTLAIAAPLLEEDAQITFLIDGLDRLIRAERFREFAEQDLRALRGTKVTVIIVAPFTLLYDKGRFLQDYFEQVKHIPAGVGTGEIAFLTQILERRGGLELMNRTELNSIVRSSGGVIRDLLTLASAAAAYAYQDNEDKIGPRHVRAAIRQLGNRYLAGLGNPQKRLLRRLANEQEFPLDDPVALQLLVNRQVLEHTKNGRETFTVHPALSKVLPKSA